ncbi:MAG: hypothetical protein EOP84_23485 [Verrucomicrobiaceae bacterium]|nr:MAG: hypothetical protein EOP84_23485 [Verrucomicrobiaceae bacterium]
MMIRYRDHLALVTELDTIDAEIAELGSTKKLPTKTTATDDEGIDVCLQRAFDLIDLYVDAQAQADQISEHQAMVRQEGQA